MATDGIMPGEVLMTLAPSPVQSTSGASGPMRRFSVDEYHRMIQVGILEEGDPVELIDGVVEVYADPAPFDAAAGYRTRADFTRGQSVPLAVGGQTLAVRVDDLLP